MGYGMYYRAREFTHLPPFTPYLIDEQLLFLTWSEGIVLEQWSFPIVCIPNSPNTGMIFMHGGRPAIEN
jgi:hypothetical protein